MTPVDRTGRHQSPGKKPCHIRAERRSSSQSPRRQKMFTMVSTLNEQAHLAAAASDRVPAAIDVRELHPRRTAGAAPLARCHVPPMAHRSREPVAA
jgi:hypothetical protein